MATTTRKPVQRGIMDQCINCCTPVSGDKKFVDFEVPGTAGKTKTVRYLPAAVALNYIFKASGKRLESSIENGAIGHLGLCHPCWTTVSNLYLLYRQLLGLTKLDSLVNRTFELIDSKISASKTPNLVKIPPVLSKPTEPRVESPEKLESLVKQELQDMEIPVSADEEVTVAKEPLSFKPRILMRAARSQRSETPVPIKALNVDSGIQIAQPRKSPTASLLHNVSTVAQVDKKNTQNNSKVMPECIEIPCDPDPRSVKPSGATTAAGGLVRVGEHKYILKMKRYCGPCSALNCRHTFKGTTRLEIQKHFREVHSRTITFQVYCHICWTDLKSPVHDIDNLEHLRLHNLDPEIALKDCMIYNDSVLRSKCGLTLTRDEDQITVKVSDPAKVIKQEEEQRFEFPELPKPKKLKKTLIRDPRSCPKCGRVLRNPYTLTLHMRRHFGNTAEKCPICGKPLGSKQALEIHLGTHRNPEERVKERARKALECKKPANQEICHECGKVLANRACLNSHLKTHIPKEVRRKFACKEPNCNYRAMYKDCLRRHQIMHSSYFKFKCDRCSQGFKLGSQVKNHQGFCCDPKERPHQCANCEKRFKLKPHLEIHYHEVHKMSVEEARALVYPGLPVRCWNGARRKQRSSESVQRTNKSEPASDLL